MRTKKKYVRLKDRRVGLLPSQRTIDRFEKNANQWTITPQQIRFVELWLTPKINNAPNPYFGDAYQAATQAGFSDSYAKRIVTESEGLEWVREARKRLVSFAPTHTLKQLENMALHAKKDSDRIRALELIARIQGLFIDRSIQQIDVQFTNSVPRPVTDVEVSQRPQSIDSDITHA
jgi:hypothetical protein